MLKESVFRILANRIIMLDVRWSISISISIEDRLRIPTL